MKARAFTLIELLVAITIFATIALVLYSSFRGGVVSWRRINSELSTQQKVRHTLDRMSRDFKNMQFLSNLPFEGSADSIKLISFVRSEDTSGSSIGRISYYISSEEEGLSAGTIIRKEESLRHALSTGFGAEEERPASETETQQTERLIDSVSEFKLSYLNVSEEEGEEGGRVFEWLDMWEQERGLPLGIRVEFTLTLPGQNTGKTFSKRVYIPVATPSGETTGE